LRTSQQQTYSLPCGNVTILQQISSFLHSHLERREIHLCTEKMIAKYISRPKLSNTVSSTIIGSILHAEQHRTQFRYLRKGQTRSRSPGIKAVNIPTHLPQKILQKQKQKGIEIKFVKQPAVEDVETSTVTWYTSNDAESLGRYHRCFDPGHCSTKLAMDQIEESLYNVSLQDFRQTTSRQKQR
jgi:hypothetical protein